VLKPKFKSNLSVWRLGIRICPIRYQWKKPLLWSLKKGGPVDNSAQIYKLAYRAAPLSWRLSGTLSSRRISTAMPRTEWVRQTRWTRRSHGDCTFRKGGKRSLRPCHRPVILYGKQKDRQLSLHAKGSLSARYAVTLPPA